MSVCLTQAAVGATENAEWKIGGEKNARVENEGVNSSAPDCSAGK